MLSLARRLFPDQYLDKLVRANLCRDLSHKSGPNIQQDETLQDKHESNISVGQTGDLPHIDNVDSVGRASLRVGVRPPLAGADVAVRLINISPCEDCNSVM